MRAAVRIIVASGLFAFATAAASAKQPPLDYQDPPPDPPAAGVIQQTDPGHFQSPGTVPDRLNGTGAFQRLPFIDESGFVVVDVRTQPYWKAGYADPVLTNACRLGDFVSVPLNRMVVKFIAGEGQAALAYIPPDRRHLLVDKRNLARPGETYYFLSSTFPNCEVWVENAVKPYRKLNKGGTSLDPADPKALAKKKALIQSWEKPDQKQ